MRSFPAAWASGVPGGANGLGDRRCRTLSTGGERSSWLVHALSPARPNSATGLVCPATVADSTGVRVVTSSSPESAGTPGAIRHTRSLVASNTLMWLLMASSPTDAPAGASLFIDVWVKAKSEDGARVLARRVAERGKVPAGAFEVVGFDGTRELWKLTGVVELPSSAAEGAWAALRIAGRLARSVSVSGPQVHDGGQWSLEGHAVEAEISAPDSAFLAFSARSMPVNPSRVAGMP